MLQTIILFCLNLALANGQSYTFPLSPGQPYPQYNNAFQSRYSYIPSHQQNTQIGDVQMNGMGGQMNQFQQLKSQQNPMIQRFQFNPMTRIQVQPPIQESISPFSSKITSPIGPSEYQVDQRPSLPSVSPSGPVRIIPPFLKSASVADQDKFYEIVQHPTWSGIEKNQRIEEFMRTMSDERQSMYSNFRRDVVDREMEEKRKNVDKAVSQMTKEAVEEFQRVVRIMQDPSQPEQEKLKKIEEIYSKLPTSIRREFDEKLKGF